VDNFSWQVGKVTWGHGVVSKCTFDLYLDTQVGALLRGVRSSHLVTLSPPLPL